MSTTWNKLKIIINFKLIFWLFRFTFQRIALMSCVRPFSCSTAWHNVFLTFVQLDRLWRKWRIQTMLNDFNDGLYTLQSCFEVQCIVTRFYIQTDSFMQLLLNYIGRPWYCNQCVFFMQSVRFFKMRNSNRGILSSLWSVKMPQNAPILYKN